jgi:hypothetical protein
MKVELKGMRDKISGMERTQDQMKVRQDYLQIIYIAKLTSLVVV